MIIDLTQTKTALQVGAAVVLYQKSATYYIMLMQLHDLGLISTKTLCDEMGVKYKEYQ